MSLFILTLTCIRKIPATKLKPWQYPTSPSNSEYAVKMLNNPICPEPRVGMKCACVGNVRPTNNKRLIRIKEGCPGLVDYVIIWIKEPKCMNKERKINKRYIHFLNKQNIKVSLIGTFMRVIVYLWPRDIICGEAQLPGDF